MDRKIKASSTLPLRHTMDLSLLLPSSPLWLFFVLVFGIIALPGMDMAFVLGSSLVGGLRSGLAATAGVVAGGVVHTALAGLGVGLALQSLPQLFNGLLTIGALYLAWIGWSLVRGAAALGEVRPERSQAWWSTFWRGVITCLLNPKAYLFTAAVFPQFMRPEHGSLVTQAVAMGAIIAATQFAIYGGVALGGVRFKAWLGASGRAQVVAGQAMGWLLIGGAAWSLGRGWQVF
jgi:threonine/homoserine/homoserine lactone efflux protein